MTPASGALSFPVHVAHLPKDGLAVRFEGTDKERTALARGHGLLDVQSFACDLVVTKWRGDGVKIAGKLVAEVTQQCVVTLEPLEGRVETDFEGVFIPENSKLARLATGERGEIMVHAESADLPETFSGTTIDAGALAEEFFELALDPYPRKPGADFQQPQAAGDAAESPFARLSALKGARD